MRIELKNQRLVYLGAIDDKVIQYKSLSEPDQQLNRLLFFSTILGDPLVVNDGYLLHSNWGWNMLTDSESPLRQLNRVDHALLASRSPKPPSEWVREQAERTETFRQVLKGHTREDFERLDKAKSEIKSIGWPDVDLQVGLMELLRASTKTVADQVGVTCLKTLEAGFNECIKRGGTVRNCWEQVLLAMEEEKKLDAARKSILMELANEAYHVNFSAGLAKLNGGAGVGVSGYGRCRFDGLQAYQAEAAQGMRELLESGDLKVFKKQIVEASKVSVPKEDKALYGEGKLADFVVKCAKDKEKYQLALREFIESGRPIKERSDAFVEAVRAYAAVIERAFGDVKAGKRLLVVADFFRHAGYLADTVGIAVLLLGSRVPIPSESIKTGAEFAGPILHGLDIGVGQLRRVVKYLKEDRISLLEKWNDGFYELNLNQAFAAEHAGKLPEFRSKAAERAS